MRHQIWKKGTALTAAFALAVVPALAGCGAEQKEKAADSGKSGEQDKEKKDVIRDTIYKPAFMPTFTPYVPVIDPSRVTCDKLKTNILGGVNEL